MNNRSGPEAIPARFVHFPHSVLAVLPLSTITSTRLPIRSLLSIVAAKVFFMAFDTRCPECKAKLQLDEAPDSDLPIECPKCGSLFRAPRPEGDKKPKADKGSDDKKAKSGGKKPFVPKKKKAKKKRTNPVFLLAAIGFGFIALGVIFSTLIWLAGRAGRVEEMLTYVPGDANWARGVNVSQLAKYPGYTSEVTKFLTADVKSAADEFATAAGQDPAIFVDYLIIAKTHAVNGTGTMYVLRSAKSMKPGTGKAIQNAAESNVGGETVYKFTPKAPGILAGSIAYMPTNRLVVIVTPSRLQDAMINGSTAGKKSKKDSFAGGMDPTCKVMVRGSIWLLVRMTGSLKPYLSNSVQKVDQDFKSLYEEAKTSPTFGVWTSPGGTGVRVGVGFECKDAAAAKALVKFMKDGQLGKGDESEPTNQMKSAGISFVSNKKTFGEFMQYLSFTSEKSCAYLVSVVSGDNAKQLLDAFNKPDLGSDASGGGQGGFGGGPGGRPGGGGP